jgi:hypothetical protein
MEVEMVTNPRSCGSKNGGPSNSGNTGDYAGLSGTVLDACINNQLISGDPCLSLEGDALNICLQNQVDNGLRGLTCDCAGLSDPELTQCIFDRLRSRGSNGQNTAAKPINPNNPGSIICDPTDFGCAYKDVRYVPDNPTPSGAFKLSPFDEALNGITDKIKDVIESAPDWPKYIHVKEATSWENNVHGYYYQGKWYDCAPPQLGILRPASCAPPALTPEWKCFNGNSNIV